MDKNAIIQDYSWASPPSGLLWLGVALAILLIAAAAAAVLLYRRKKALLLQSEGLEAKRPAHEVALESLEKLLGLMREESYAEFVTEVSRLLRVYIQDRYDLRAPHRSTEEFLAEVSEDAQIIAEHRLILAEFLHCCDLVKFARRQVLPNHMKSLYRIAKSFVESTMPQPVSSAPATVGV